MLQDSSIKAIYKYCALCLFSLAFIACSRGKINIDQHEALALDPAVQYMVITSAFTSFYETPSFQAKTVAYVRKGEIYMITGVKIAKDDSDLHRQFRWYQCEKGWVCSGDASQKSNTVLRIFDNKIRAKNFVKTLDITQ